MLYKLMILIIVCGGISACSDDSERQKNTSQAIPEDNIMVNRKTMQTIQEAKNMDALLQKSVDQKTSELDKY